MSIMSTSPSATRPDVTKHFTSSILLWVRTDQPRQTGMDHWKGPHSGIISATPGLEEYRQIHLDACYLWAFSAISRSPGARAYYDRQRAGGRSHHQALRALSNRLVGILDGCIRHGQLYDEQIGWASSPVAAA